jgi:hypothetical protein
MAADVARQPAPSGAAEAATDFLRHSHQRVGERHQPQQGEACLRASLRIGGNPARIIVGGASDQPRSEDAEQTRLRWTDDWIKAINRKFWIVLSSLGHDTPLRHERPSPLQLGHS